ncbi:hypothetical protein EI94DRAFT_1723389 [Lactarius quietus]|nr:hypothetical protein EI94DRAFT_1723389 [Lactarius quietus]
MACFAVSLSSFWFGGMANSTTCSKLLHCFCCISLGVGFTVPGKCNLCSSYALQHYRVRLACRVGISNAINAYVLLHLRSIRSLLRPSSDLVHALPTVLQHSFVRCDIQPHVCNTPELNLRHPSRPEA